MVQAIILVTLGNIVDMYFATEYVQTMSSYNSRMRIKVSDILKSGSSNGTPYFSVTTETKQRLLIHC